MAEDHKCEHSACNCNTAKDSKYCNQYCHDLGGRSRREPKRLEFINISARSIPTSHRLAGQFHSRDVDHAFPGGFQNVEGEVAIADNAAYDGRLEIDHRVP